MISGLRTIGGVQLGAIVMDWAGVFLLAGMIRYTSLYRKRGRNLLTGSLSIDQSL